MFEPVFHDPFATKGAEYLLLIAFLLGLIMFWRLLNTSPRRFAPALDRNPSVGWFRLAGDRLYHPGHGWARPEDDGTVLVGLDEFAATLVGPVASITLPEVGAAVGQGEVAWRLVAGDGRSVEMLSPVDGAVVGVNPGVAHDPSAALSDPYGEGWLLKVRPSRLRANATSLLSGETASRWMQEVVAGLQARLAPGLGPLAQDGGTPVAGMARSLDAERWDAIARTFLLTGRDNDHV